VVSLFGFPLLTWAPCLFLASMACSNSSGIRYRNAECDRCRSYLFQDFADSAAFAFQIPIGGSVHPLLYNVRMTGSALEFLNGLLAVTYPRPAVSLWLHGDQRGCRTSTRSRSEERLASFALELRPEKTRLIESSH
jgi:hypothetical protein